MKRAVILLLLMGTGCVHAPEPAQAQAQAQANPAFEGEFLVRDGVRTTWTSTRNADYTASCYATTVNTRSDGLSAVAARSDGVGGYRVVVKDTRSGNPIAVVNVTSVGTMAGETDTRSSTAELFMRRGARSGVEGFRKFLTERC